MSLCDSPAQGLYTTVQEASELLQYLKTVQCEMVKESNDASVHNKNACLSCASCAQATVQCFSLFPFSHLSLSPPSLLPNHTHTQWRVLAHLKGQLLHDLVHGGEEGTLQLFAAEYANHWQCAKQAKSLGTHTHIHTAVKIILRNLLQTWLIINVPSPCADPALTDDAEPYKSTIWSWLMLT